MHMADALVSPAVAASMYACSSVVAGYSVRKVRLEDDAKKIPVMGVMGAFVFATQMINFTIPGTGASGHLCGGMLLSAILGPFAGFLTMIGVLLIQCLMFADGGILALGCNIWNMAFYGCFIGAMFIWSPIMNRCMTKKRIIAASIIGCTLTLQLGAFSVVLETLLSGISELSFGAFVMAMQPIHLVIGMVEGLITAAVLCFIYDARPELLCNSESDFGRKQGRFTYKQTIVIIVVAVAIIGGVLALFASDNPDGLEWAMEKVAGTSELISDGKIYDKADDIQTTTAILPDYSIKDSDSAVGTTISGLVGGAVVIVVCMGACYIFKFFRKKESGA
ncbi:MAG: energy-coupling factor ABC transporter permease [Agathobacter sp.]|nr:energy-coupling factor ABC transporter permease [Agathobacter sp.]